MPVTESNETSGSDAPAEAIRAESIKGAALPVLAGIYQQLIAEHPEVVPDLAHFLAAGAGPGAKQIGACLSQQHAQVGRTLLELGSSEPPAPDPVATEILETVVEPAMQELYDRIPELAEQLLVDPGELKEYIDGLSDEFFMNELSEATDELR